MQLHWPLCGPIMLERMAPGSPVASSPSSASAATKLTCALCRPGHAVRPVPCSSQPSSALPVQPTAHRSERMSTMLHCTRWRSPTQSEGLGGAQHALQSCSPSPAPLQDTCQGTMPVSCAVQPALNVQLAMLRPGRACSAPQKLSLPLVPSGRSSSVHARQDVWKGC